MFPEHPERVHGNLPKSRITDNRRKPVVPTIVGMTNTAAATARDANRVLILSTIAFTLLFAV
ncbi:MAG: hypothetical protein ABI560_10190, partial [Myxococcales bacterium]